MIKTLYKPKRWRNGKRVVSRLYSLKLRLSGENGISCIALGVTDRQVAEEKARQIVQEREKEMVGLLAPKVQREAAQASLGRHIQEFIGDLKAKGRNRKYIDQLESQLGALSTVCGWQSVKEVTPDSFVRWRSCQKQSPKTLNEYLAGVKGLLNWMVGQGRLASNPLASVQKVETRGREVRPRRAYANDELKALIEVAGKYRLVCLTAVLTGIRHGELKRLCWGDFNLSLEKPSVVVRASISKNHKQACLPLYPALAVELSRFRPANAVAGDLVFAGMVPRSEAFNLLLKKGAIAKVDSQGRVVDFHSLRHTFCTNLHRAGVPQREAMELMRHNDPRLTANTYADASLFSLRSAVDKLPWNGLEDDAQGDAQRNGFGGHLPSLAVTVEDGTKSENGAINTGLKSLSVTVCHGQSKSGEWSERQDLNLRHLGTKPSALPG